MASLSEKIASNVNFGAFAKAEDLQKRLWFTLLMLIVCRLGTFVPLPGIDATILSDIFEQNSGGILGMFDMFAGGALSRMTIFALNIMPYISASIIVQLGTSILPSLMALRKEGESGHRKINQYTRYLTVFIAILQGYAIAASLMAMTTSSGASAVVNPGPMFIFTTVVSLVGGTLFVVWIGEQITARGVGNGSSLIITLGIVAGIAPAIAKTLKLARVGEISGMKVLVLTAIILAVIYIVVLVERAQRRIIIQYPRRAGVGMGMLSSDSTHLPLKINPTGVIPPIFASSILLLPITIVNLVFKAGSSPNWLSAVATALSRGSWFYMGLYAALIVFFTFFYTAIVFNPEETADNLKKHGGFVAGIRPGQATADYLDYVLTRLSVLGAFYLVSLCILPEILASQMSLPFFFGGTSVMIVVSVAMEFMNQIQSYLLAHQYESLLKKASKRRGK